ncbi:MAG TPA: hypothetical protein VNL77_10355 [Roseiflexaceae bacterium]|nr:hypothetical protein [Roseiflexaceae bacterium]
MPRRGLWPPLAIIAAGLLLTMTVLARTDEPPSARTMDGHRPARMQEAETPYPYPSPEATAAATTAPATPQTPATPAPAVGTPATAAPPPVVSALPTASTPEPAAQTMVPTEPPLPTPQVKLSGTVPCTPGETITVRGEGPPRAPILLFFGQRTVGGGSAGPDGAFTLPLIVGMERAGEYVVSARVRGSEQVLLEFICSVPPVTPTPLPGRTPIP